MKTSRQITYQDRMKLRGRCIRCGEKLDRKGVHCASCAEKKYEEHKRWVARQKEKGLCVSCTNKAVPGYAQCEYHRSYKRNRRREP